MKKKLAIILASVLILSSITGCNSASSSTENDSGPEITTSIELGDSIEIDGNGAEATENGVSITKAGTYGLSGTLKDGTVIVSAPGEAVTLVLNGVDITKISGPAILFSEASEATVYIEDGTKNVLTGGGDDYDAALYSIGTMTIKGNGDLTVNGYYQEGIASEMHLNIEGGNIDITSADDGLNANNDGVSIITISGGELFVEAGGDGIDSNGSIIIEGGTVTALGAITDASNGLDADGDITINGGTVIATGAQNPKLSANSKQKAITANFNLTQKADTLVSIKTDGSEILGFKPSVEFQALFFSSPDIAEDISYEIYLDGTLASTVTTESASQINGGQPPQGERPERGDGAAPKEQPPQ